MKNALPAAAALALAACAQDADNNTVAAEEMTIDDSATSDPATANLAINSSPAAVDPAINQTDQQSDLGNTVD